MKKALWVGVVALILFIAGITIKAMFFGPSDKELIQEALKETTVAAREGRPTMVLTNLSKKFNYGGEMPIRMDISKVVEQAKPDISILNPEPRIEGDQATVFSPVAVKMSAMGMSFDNTVPDVTIILEREWSFSGGIFPRKKWKIIEVSADSLPNY